MLPTAARTEKKALLKYLEMLKPGNKIPVIQNQGWLKKNAP